MKVNFIIHESHLPLWENTDWRYALLMGGRGNGRSGTASRYAVSQLLSKEYTRGAMMRAVRSDVEASCLGDIKDRLLEENIFDSFNVTENDITRGQNSLRVHGFRASSGSLTARLKSLAGYNFVWIEEAEEIGEEEFRKLDDTLRTVKGRIRIIFTLNTPPKNHWIIKKWFDLDPHPEAQGFYIPKIKEDIKDAIYIGGTWKENEPNMDENTIERYKNYKYTNPNYYWQVIEGLAPDEVRGKIYTGWQQIDHIPQETRLVKFGLDFGWLDPACVVAIYYWNGSYIIDEVAYGSQLTNEFLAKEIKDVQGTAITIADNAEPKSISEMNKYGINVQPCEKGKDSVSFGIKVVTQKKIFVTKRSTNVWEAYENYSWKEDKDGNSLNEPDHKWSDPMDAVRYGIASMHNKRSDIIIHKPPREKRNIAV